MPTRRTTSMRSLSLEARQKLAAIRPATLAQASRIPGVSPTDLQNLVLEMEKFAENRRAEIDFVRLADRARCAVVDCE